IEAGNNTYPQSAYDLDGNPRTSGTNVDAGAYETNYIIPIVTANASQTDFCDGTSIALFGSGTGGGKYSWDNGVTDNMPFTPSISGTYNLVGTDGAGCSATDFISITVHPLPTVSAFA